MKKTISELPPGTKFILEGYTFTRTERKQTTKVPFMIDSYAVRMVQAELIYCQCTVNFPDKSTYLPGNLLVVPEVNIQNTRENYW